MCYQALLLLLAAVANQPHSKPPGAAAAYSPHHPPPAPPVALGCYADGDGHGGAGPRLFSTQRPDMPANKAGPAACAASCAMKAQNFTLVGIEDATQCFCGGSREWAVAKARQAPASHCNFPCAAVRRRGLLYGDKPQDESCGGSWALSLYWVGAAPAPPLPPPPLPPPPPPPLGPPAPRPVFDCPPAWLFCNSSLPLEARLDDFIAALSTHDKLQILGQSASGTRDGRSLWSRGYNWWTEDLHGLRVSCPRRNGHPFGRCPTQFPEANLVGCSFNRTLFGMLGEAISTEDRVYYTYGVINGLSVFAPQINLNANPLWGRVRLLPVPLVRV
jgi:hypothetical protein